MEISHIAFLTPGNYAQDDPRTGLEAALRLFAAGEALGFDGAWVRSRHLERGVSSAATFLAAASQRTRRIELGAAVIQLGYENTFRLAEDLATADLLSDGRIQVGLSAGPLLHGALLGERLFEGDTARMDFSYERAVRLRENLSGGFLGDPDQIIHSPAGEQRAQVQRYSPGLSQRLWYGGGSIRCAQWAGHAGFHLLIGNLNQGEQSDHFFDVQRIHLDLYRQAWSGSAPPRIGLGRVIVPTDSADESSRQRYAAFAASRRERTLAPQGPRRTLYAEDLVGSSDQILEALRRDPILPKVNELRIEAPYNLAYEQYMQILTDFVERIAPALGWRSSRDSSTATSAGEKALADT
jgi:alkanesulfonate monooxygenase SsuD/methylene tetrahydromethanopterin reductase-like flavin-dependent oxidoreductase (luciferase family)